MRLRAERTGNLHDQLYLAAESELSALLGHVDAVRPGLLIVDSVQTISSAEVDGAAGGVTQVRAMAGALVALAKERGLPVMLVGHVTKDGNDGRPAGAGAPGGRRAARSRATGTPRCAWCAGSRTGSARPTRSAASSCATPASSACPTRAACSWTAATSPWPARPSRWCMEGKRPLLAEVQALVSQATCRRPRRAVSGLDSARVAMLARGAGEARPAAAGRSRTCTRRRSAACGSIEPAADLALALAVASAKRGRGAAGGRGGARRGRTGRRGAAGDRRGAAAGRGGSAGLHAGAGAAGLRRPAARGAARGRARPRAALAEMEG